MIGPNHSRKLAVRWRAGCFQVLFLLPALIAGVNLIPAGRVAAQTLINLEGADPNAGLISQNAVWDGNARRQSGRSHGIRRQHRWNGFYESVQFHAALLSSKSRIG